MKNKIEFKQDILEDIEFFLLSNYYKITNTVKYGYQRLVRGYDDRALQDFSSWHSSLVLNIISQDIRNNPKDKNVKQKVLVVKKLKDLVDFDEKNFNFYMEPTSFDKKYDIKAIEIIMKKKDKKTLDTLLSLSKVYNKIYN